MSLIGRPAPGRRATLLFAASAVLVAAALLGLALAALLAGEREEAVLSWSEQIEVAADLRREAIEGWLTERTRDLALVARFPTVGELLAAPSRPPGDAATHLAPILREVLRSQGLDWIRVADAGNVTLLTEPPALPIEAADLEVASRALASGELAIGSRQRSAAPELLVTIALPVPTAGPGSAPLGSVQAAAPAGEWLESLLGSFAAGSRTAEALLAIEERGRLVFATPLRQARAAPFELALAVDTPELAAAAAAAGVESTGVYRDYRGVEVLAAPRRIAGAPWVLVTKIDVEEVLEAYREERAALIAGACGLLVAVGALALLIGHRRSARERLARSEAAREALRQRDAIAEAAPVFLLELDAEGRILYANRTPGGAPRESLEGDSLLERLPEALQPPVEAAFGRALEGEPQQLEVALALDDGEARDYLVTLKPNGEATPRRVLVSAIDVTESRRAERGLAESETRLRAFFDSNVVGILEGDVHGRVFAANDEFLRIVGYGRDELEAGRIRWTDLTPPEFLPLDDRGIAEAKARGVCTPYEKQYVRKDGGRVWVLVGFVLLEPERERSVAFILDISERKRFELDLRRLHAAIEHTDEAVVVTDTEPRIEYVNAAFERISGYSRAEVLGRNPRILQSGVHPRSFYRAMWERLTRGETWRGRMVNRRKDGTLFEEEATISPVVDAAGAPRHYVAVKRDLARERQLEQELERTRRLEALGRLAGGIAHDFNNALGVILGYAESLRDGLAPHDPRRAPLTEILRAADGARGLSRQLLAFGKRRPGDRRPLDPAAAVRELARLLGPLLGERIEVELALAADGGWVHFDPAQFDQILTNLVLNARDAMPEGGRLAIATRQVELDGREASGLPPGRYVRLTVRDDGTGMSPETLERIFEPFFTTKPEGTGLGLPTVYGLVEEAGGRVTIDSAPGAGTRVDVLLPRLEPPPEEARANEAGARAAAPTPAAADAEPRRRILVVEDQESLLRLVRLTLERLGYEVLTASAAPEAERVAEGGAAIDLLLTDVVLPGASGPALAASLAARQPRLRVLFVSGYPSGGGTGREVPEEIAPLLPKPFTAAELGAAVRAALDGPPYRAAG